MKWFRHCELSQSDVELLKGTATMESLQRHRLVVAYGPEDTQATPKQLGLLDLTNLYYIRRLNNETIEILFVDEDDMCAIEQKITQFKMTVD